MTENPTTSEVLTPEPTSAPASPKVSLYAHAIAVLQVALDAARNNGPIHEKEGNLEQAALAARTAEDCEQAINNLHLMAQGEITSAAAAPAPDYPDLRERVAQLEKEAEEGAELVSNLQRQLEAPAAPAYPDLRAKVTELEEALAAKESENAQLRTYAPSHLKVPGRPKSEQPLGG